MAGNAAAEQRRGDARRSKWAAAVPARVCQAVLAETIIPTLDRASNSPTYVTVRLAPEITRDVTPPATLPPAGPAPPVSLSSNFRLNIAGLDCTKVTKIDSFTVKPRLAGETLANGRYQDAIQAAPANLLEFPNLQIELATVSEETWRAWFRSFVIDGNSSAMNEKTGTLSFLAPNLSTVLATISFQNLGIFRLEDAPARRKRRDNARCRGALLRANETAIG